MLKERIFSGIIGISIILAILYAGGVYWIVFFALLGIAALYEFHRMFQFNYKPSLLLSIIFFLLIMFYNYNNWFVYSLVLFMFFLVIYLVMGYPRINIVDIALSIFPALYVGFASSFVLLILDNPQSFLIMLAIFLLTWSSDIGGYLFGSLWGRRKIAPVISPNKTWAGSMGGIFLSILVILAYFHIVSFGNYDKLSIIILAVFASFAAQFGDLFISSVKRAFTIKDTGSLIPGHGGVLDRFDSFFLVLPIVYCLLNIL